MRRATLLVVLVAATSAPTTWASTLGEGEAYRYARWALDREFTPPFSEAYSQRLRCLRMTQRRFRCSVAWVVGDSAYSGRARIWVTGGWWNYGWTIKRVNEYCLATGGTRENCTHLHKIKRRKKPIEL